MDIIGQSNVPTEGPIIFTGNHANQFVDALQVSSRGLMLNALSWLHPSKRQSFRVEHVIQVCDDYIAVSIALQVVCSVLEHIFK